MEINKPQSQQGQNQPGRQQQAGGTQRPGQEQQGGLGRKEQQGQQGKNPYNKPSNPMNPKTGK